VALMNAYAIAHLRNVRFGRTRNADGTAILVDAVDADHRATDVLAA